MFASVAEVVRWRWTPWLDLGAVVEAERERLILWAPVFYGAGIGAYFGRATEPDVWVAGAGALAAAGLVWFSRRRAVPLLLCAALALFASGFAAAKLRTELQAAPVLTRETGTLMLSGRVVALESHGKARRAILDRLVLPGVDPAETPAKVRIRLLPRDTAKLGERMQVLVRLRPPPIPVLPGGYDFQRRAYFQRIGSVGFALQPGRTVPGISPAGWLDRAGLWVGGLRQALNDRIRASLPEVPGAVAVALITGDRGAIPRPVLDDMRAAGLAHLLAISGLHLGLVSALIFGGVRLCLALVGPLALRFPIKKWAALAALAGSLRIS